MAIIKSVDNKPEGSYANSANYREGEIVCANSRHSRQVRGFQFVKNACLAALAASLLLAGCTLRQNGLSSHGLPSDKYLIGGGFKVEWTAPTDGTFIVGEKTTGKILVTESATEGEEVEFSMGDDEDFTTLEKLLGVPLKDARIQAYWIPGKTKPKADAE